MDNLPSEKKNIDVSGLYIDKEKYIWWHLGSGVFRINPSKNEIKKIEVPFDYSSIFYILMVMKKMFHLEHLEVLS